MSMQFTNQPNYFFFAQTLINHFVSHINQTKTHQYDFALADIYQLFDHDFAATTANLEGILNIADSYIVAPDNSAQQVIDPVTAPRLIAGYHIDAEHNILQLHFNAAAVDILGQGGVVLPPDAAQYE